MGTKMRSLRVADDLWEWAGEEAKRQRTTRTGLVTALLLKARDGNVTLAEVVPGGRKVASPGPEARLATARTPFPNSTAAERPGVRVDSVPQARRWAMDRQRKLNEAKERAR